MPELTQAQLDSLKGRWFNAEPPRYGFAESWRRPWLHGRRIDPLTSAQLELAFAEAHRLHGLGYRDERVLRRRLLDHLRDQRGAYGFGPMVWIGIISLSVNLIRLYLEWRRSQV